LLFAEAPSPSPDATKLEISIDRYRRGRPRQLNWKLDETLVKRDGHGRAGFALGSFVPGSRDRRPPLKRPLSQAAAGEA